MKRLTQRLVAGSLAVSALGLAAAALEGARRETPIVVASAAAPGPSLFETLVLLRWGYGALDWLAPEETGDRNERDRQRRD
jgi:hypothetical protein